MGFLPCLLSHRLCPPRPYSPFAFILSQLITSSSSATTAPLGARRPLPTPPLPSETSPAFPPPWIVSVNSELAGLAMTPNLGSCLHMPQRPVPAPGETSRLHQENLLLGSKGPLLRHIPPAERSQLFLTLWHGDRDWVPST